MSDEDDAPAAPGDDEGSAASTDEDTSPAPEIPDPAAADPGDVEPAVDPEPSSPELPSIPETPPLASEPVAVTEPSNNDGPTSVSVDVAQAAPVATFALAAAPDDAPPTGGGVADVLSAATAVSVTSAPAAASAAPAAAVATQLVPAAQAALASPVSVVSGLVSGLLAWVGLGPSLVNAPVAPFQSAGLWGLLAWVRREVERTFFNQSPTTAYNPLENSQAVNGVVTGDLHAADFDDDPLVFTVTQAPQKGSLVVNPDGTFTYTPSAQLTVTGGTDVFTVEVEDQGFHSHGLPGLLNLVTFGLLGDSGHSTTATVTLTVQPINQAPQVGNPQFTIDTVDPDTGVVTGTVNITDPNGDSLAYSFSGVPNEGTFSVNAGEWTFTPSLDQRLRATDINAAPDDKEVNFSIVASDGLATIVVGITAPVTPLAITTINVGVLATEVAVSPDGATAYVTDNWDGTVWVIDTATNTVTTTITVGDGAAGVAVRPDGATAYVANFSDGTVSVIDTATNTVTTTIAVGDSPAGVAVSTDGATVYVANIGDDTVSVIDTATNAVTTIAVGNYPFKVAITPDGATVYVSNDIANTVSVIDTATNTVTATITGVNGGGVAVSPDGARTYVANVTNGVGTVSMIDTVTNTVIAAIPVGGDPYGVAVSADGTRLYVTTNSADGIVSVITLG